MSVDPTTTSIAAHFDPDGLVAPHVERFFAELAGVSDRLIICSTAELTPRSRRRLSSIGELIERENLGYDFYSWRIGLLASGSLNEGERIILANDSVVGPLIPLSDITTRMRGRRTAFWGISSSSESHPAAPSAGRHLQTYLMGFEPRATSSPYFRRFWTEFRPPRSRTEAILTGELRLTGTLMAGELDYSTYFDPGPIWLWRSAFRRERSIPPETRGRFLGFAWRAARNLPAHAGNPMTGLWDESLHEGRLPFVKVEALRDDPYGLGRSQMLRRLEERWPTAFFGVRDYIERTAPRLTTLRDVP